MKMFGSYSFSNSFFLFSFLENQMSQLEKKSSMVEIKDIDNRSDIASSGNTIKLFHTFF